jgi:hypothetical protein
MPVEVLPDTPLAEALNSVIQPKLNELGWVTGGADDTALTEYVVLMLINGKSQDEIAFELSGDLLGLGPDDPGARQFATWLFEQIDILNSQFSGAVGTDSMAGISNDGEFDTDMNATNESSAGLNA